MRRGCRKGARLIQMSNLPVTVVATHTDPFSQPPGLSLCRDNLDGELGHITVNLSTPYLVVSGYTHLDLVLTSIAVPIKLHDVKVELIQTYILQNLARHSDNAQITPIMQPLWSLKANSDSKTQNFRAGESCRISQKIRLPNEYDLRPTTPSEAVTGIRIIHRLSVTMVYTPIEAVSRMGKKEYRVSTSATISSCRCKLDHLQLPAYSADAKTLPDSTERGAAPCLVSATEPMCCS